MVTNQLKILCLYFLSSHSQLDILTSITFRHFFFVFEKKTFQFALQHILCTFLQMFNKSVHVVGYIFVKPVKKFMPGPCIGKNLISILITQIMYIQKGRGQALLLSFEYNLLPNVISNFNNYMDRATEQSTYMYSEKPPCIKHTHKKVPLRQKSAGFEVQEKIFWPTFLSGFCDKHLPAKF